MGWLDSWAKWFFQASGGPTIVGTGEAAAVAPELIKDVIFDPWAWLTDPQKQLGREPSPMLGTLTESEKRAKRIGNGLILAGAAAVGGSLAYGYYYSGKRKKKAPVPIEQVNMAQDSIKGIGKALTTSTVLVAPLAYLLIETMENYPIKQPDGTIDHIIGGEFGDKLQSLVAAAVSADLASQLGKLIPG